MIDENTEKSSVNKHENPEKETKHNEDSTNPKKENFKDTENIDSKDGDDKKNATGDKQNKADKKENIDEDVSKAVHDNHNHKEEEDINKIPVKEITLPEDKEPSQERLSFLSKPTDNTFIARFYKQGEVRLRGDQKIIKSQAVSSLVDLEKMRTMAEQEMVSKSKAFIMETSSIKNKHEEEGFNKGLNRIANIVVNQEKMFFEVKTKLENMIQEMTLLSVKKIIQQEVEQNPLVVRGVVSEAFKLVSNKSNIVLFVNKEDKDTVIDSNEEISKFLKSANSFKVEESEEVERGGCIIQTEDGVLNANVSNMIELLGKNLQGNKWW